MFSRCRPLVCGTAILVSFGAQQPTRCTACVGWTASANNTDRGAWIARVTQWPLKLSLLMRCGQISGVRVSTCDSTHGPPCCVDQLHWRRGLGGQEYRPLSGSGLHGV